MPDASTTPTFNMKVVVQETGLKPDTLRAWERRYGVPAPERTAGGHRLYSQYEIDMLKWLIARQEEGLNISHAIELWRQLESEGQDPLLSYGHEAPAPPTPKPALVSGGRIDALREAWVEACLRFEELTAQQILAQAFAVFPMETVCFGLLQKGLQQIGAGWYEGRVSVQQEHFASALAVRQLESLLASMAPAVRKERLLVACPPGEQHTFAPLLLALLLRRRGWDVVYLGANVPLARLEAAVEAIKPQMVLVAAQTLPTAGTTMEMARLLQGMGVPLAYGGGVFSQTSDTQTEATARERIPGYFLGMSLPEAVAKVEGWLHTLPPLPAFSPVSAAHKAARLHFEERRTLIESYVHENGQTTGVPRPLLLSINKDLGDHIIAALTLGEIALLTPNMEWVQGLLMNMQYRMPAKTLRRYLSLYADGAAAHLDERGEPLLAWLRLNSK